MLTPNPYFRQRQLQDPPHVKTPHWAICEPFLRRRIQPPDCLFFAPQRTFLVQGVLRVALNANERQARRRLGEDWHNYHKEQVVAHSGVPRGGNIIIGSVRGSFWLEPGIDIRQFHFLPKSMFDNKRQGNSVPKFENADQVKSLYDELSRRGQR